MASCPFCGNEVEDYDFMCVRCGNTLTPQGTSKDSLQNTDASYTPYNRNMYDNYIHLDINEGDKERRKKEVNKNINKMLKRIAIYSVVFLMIGFIYSIAIQIISEPYKDLVENSVIAILENDYNTVAEITVIDFEGIYSDYYGDLYEHAREAMQEEHETKIAELKQKYGDDYQYNIRIRSVKNLKGKTKKDTLKETIEHYNDSLDLSSFHLKLEDYFKEQNISQIKRIKTVVTIKGSNGSDTINQYVDIAKMTGQEDWKLLIVHTYNN